MNSAENSSGVIDLRSMAAAYDRDDDPADTATASEHIGLPLSAHVVLTPSAPARESRRHKLAVLIGGAAMLIAVTALATTAAVRGLGGTVSVEPTEADLHVPVPPAEPGPPAAPAAAVAAEPEPDDEEDEEIELEEDVVSAAPREATRTVLPRDRDRRSKRVKNENQNRDRDREQVRVHQRETVKPAPEPVREPVAVAETPTESATVAATCDEVTCLVDPSGPCCEKPGAGEHGDQPDKTESRDHLPESLGRDDLAAGLRSHRGRIAACGDRHGFSGTATVKLRIGPDGRVTSATTTAGTPAFQSCLTGHIQKARFDKTQTGATLRYPFVFR